MRHDSDGADLVFPAQLTVHTIGEWHEQALGQIGRDKGRPLRLDASRVEKVDAAGLQWLLSAYLTFREKDGGFRIFNPSDSLRERLIRAGCGAMLEDGAS